MSVIKTDIPFMKENSIWYQKISVYLLVNKKIWKTLCKRVHIEDLMVGYLKIKDFNE